MMRGKVDRLAGHLATVVVKETDVEEYKAVEVTVMEVMPGVPLNLAMHSVIVDRRYYTVQKEEVLAEYEEQLESFLLPPEKKVAIEKRIREKGEEGQQEEVSPDVAEGHLSTPPLPVY